MPESSLEISNNMQASIKVLDPDISVDPVTVERKIIDTVAEVLAGGNTDQYVLNYQFDVDSKSGVDLDKFVGVWGFARQGGQRSTGVATFTSATPSQSDQVIAAGSQLIKPATSVTPVITFQTVASATLYTGSNSVDIPIECLVAGITGNVAANTITSLSIFGATGLTSVTNNVATSGGDDPESDAELRVRFKNTVLRNISGTRDQYLAIAISSQFANKANVLGPTSRYIEYLQTSASAATSIIPYSKYTYNFDYYLTDGVLGNETFFGPRGVDYTFTNTVPPSIAINNLSNIPDGSVILLEHSYCSVNSRNDPANNIGNYVDIFVNGTDETNATETAIFPGSGNNFNNTSSSAYYNQNFLRFNTRSVPVLGNRLQELMWQPVDFLSDTIIISGTTYYQNVDYWLVKDSSTWKNSKRSRDGIEWSTGAVASILANSQFTFSYTFNRLPLTINEVIDQHKQVTADILVHSSIQRFYNISFVVMYNPGSSRPTVDAAIFLALSTFLDKEQFGAIIQVSDLVDIVHNVTGVDNVRLALAGDGSSYGIQEVAPDGVTPLGGIIVSDFTLQDSDLPVLNEVFTIQKSQNSWS